MIERIKAVRKEAGLTQEEFGKRIGLTKRGYQEVEYGNNGASESSLRLICSEFNINREWLDTGVGEMHTNASDRMLVDVLMEGESDFAKDVFKHFMSAWGKLKPEQKSAVEDAFKVLIEELKKEDE